MSQVLSAGEVRTRIFTEYAGSPLLEFIRQIHHHTDDRCCGTSSIDGRIFYSTEYNMCYYKGLIYNKCDTPDDIIIKFSAFCAIYQRKIYELPCNSIEMAREINGCANFQIIYDSYLNIAFGDGFCGIIVSNFTTEYNISILYKYHKFNILDASLIYKIMENMIDCDEVHKLKIDIDNPAGNTFRKIKITVENLKTANALHYPKDLLLVNTIKSPTTFNIDEAISACEERIAKYTTHIEKLKSLKLEFIKLQTETTQLLL